MSVAFSRQLLDKKKNAQKLVMLTAYDYLTARMLDESGVDLILVGDSLGHQFSGFSTTLPVTMDAMVYHVQAVARGVKTSTIVADMPFMSYQVSLEKAKENAGRFLQEAGAHAVKIEVGAVGVEVVRSVIGMGVPVMAHLGLTPQSVYQLGGYREQAQLPEAQKALIALAKEMEALGCFAILLELVPAELAREISLALHIPVIGIGAGKGCDGQVLVTQDLVGLTMGRVPKFVTQYENLGERFSTAVRSFSEDVRQGRFPLG
jgi:3-methyl-2-oxobutanoate hydroxymethyltransferase